MQKRCAASGESFEVTERDLDFIESVSPVFNGKRYSFPAPTLSPEERGRQRLAWRNLRYLFRRPCDSSGRQILSMYDPKLGGTVYHSDEYWSDKWEALDYGREFDFSRPFFEQYSDLYRVVPRLHSYVILSENCEYINGAANCRNCYLSFNMDYCEDCYYLTGGTRVKSTVESLSLTECELCYRCIDCTGCYNLLYSANCYNCSDSYFLTGCTRCRNCIGCTNLVGKEFHVFNQPVSKEEFFKLKDSFKSYSSVTEFTKRVYQHSLHYPRKYYYGHSNESFSGDAIFHIKDSFGCFESSELENCSHCFYVFKANNCMDYTIFGDSSQWIYQSLAVGINASNNSFCIGCWAGASNNLYCSTTHSSSNCFGCIGISKKEYCILNKQYSKEDYNHLAAKIAEHMIGTGEWGQFFPPSISPFPFNETIGFQEYPLSETEATKRGYWWRESAPKSREAQNPNIPDSIEDVSDDIVSTILRCEVSGVPYKIIPQELALYRSWGVPVPRLAPEERFKSLITARTPRALFDRNCDSCSVELRSPYSPNRPERIYCEQCYREEVY